MLLKSKDSWHPLSPLLHMWCRGKQLTTAGVCTVCTALIKVNGKTHPLRNVSASVKSGRIPNDLSGMTLVQYLCCPTLKSFFTSSHWPLDIWLLLLKSWIFILFHFLTCHMYLVATVLGSTDNIENKKLVTPGHLEDILSVKDPVTFSFSISIRQSPNYSQSKYRNPHCRGHITKTLAPLNCSLPKELGRYSWIVSDSKHRDSMHELRQPSSQAKAP